MSEIDFQPLLQAVLQNKKIHSDLFFIIELFSDFAKYSEYVQVAV